MVGRTRPAADFEEGEISARKPPLINAVSRARRRPSRTRFTECPSHCDEVLVDQHFPGFEKALAMALVNAARSSGGRPPHCQDGAGAEDLRPARLLVPLISLLNF
jgi:hypothetical protein